MAQIRAQLKRAVLQSLYNQAADNAQLSDVLNGYLNSLVNGVSAGRLVELHSANGKTSKFRTPLLGEHFRPEDMAEFSMELIEVYNSALTTLGIPQPSDNSQDDTILQAMLADDRMQSVTRTRVDYTLQNWPGRF